MNEEFFQKDTAYWEIADTIKNIYMSDGSLSMLLDFEGVLDEVSIYAFKNWLMGELVDGPDISRYTVSCTFMWPGNMMPDPRGAKRLLPFDCQVKYKKTKMKIPKKVKTKDDLRGNYKKPKLILVPVWLVEITMPKDLISEIRTGSIELEGQTIDLEDLDLGYEEDLDKSAEIENSAEEMGDAVDEQDELDDDLFA